MPYLCRYAHDTLTAFMSKHGFTVTPHLCGLKTAWRAEYSFGKGGRVFGINAEMDALPRIGHGYVLNHYQAAGKTTLMAMRYAPLSYACILCMTVVGTI